MKSLKRIIILLVLSVSAFSFIKKEKKDIILEFDKKDLNVIEILKKQQFECRPSTDYLFHIETDVVKKVRGASTVDAKVFITQKSSGKVSLLASEKVQVLKFDNENSSHNLEENVLRNGDKIIGNSTKGNYSFKELISFEPIYNSYVSATNRLKNKK